jgi:hypothetical protein
MGAYGASPAPARPLTQNRMPLPGPRETVVRQRSLVQPMPSYSLVTLTVH